MLPCHYEYDFVNGQYHCDPAPGVAAIYDGPFLCWYNTPTTKKVARAHKQIYSIIEKRGPFDAVMGFSQVSEGFSSA